MTFNQILLLFKNNFHFLVALFSDIARGSYLDSFIEDLPEVNLPATAHEDFISTAKEQVKNFCL